MVTLICLLQILPSPHPTSTQQLGSVESQIMALIYFRPSSDSPCRIEVEILIMTYKVYLIHPLTLCLPFLLFPLFLHQLASLLSLNYTTNLPIRWLPLTVPLPGIFSHIFV